MSELEDILNYLETTSLEPHDDYISEFSYKDQKILWKYIKDLQKENKELSHIVANKVISDYDIDTPLKKELNEANLKIVSLEDALRCYKQEKEDLIKWLEDMIDWTAKKSNIGEKMKKDYTEQQKICWWINHTRMDILARIIDSNYE